MPPEHDLMFGLMAAIMHACRRHDKIDLTVVRLKLVRAKRAAGLRGRYNWSLRMRHGVDKVCEVLRLQDYVGPGVLMWRKAHKPVLQEELCKRVIVACELAMKRPRLAPAMSERTWQEQIVGRAAVAAKTFFPDLA